MIEAFNFELAMQGRSERLKEFLQAAPLERTSIYRFVEEQARTLAPGAHVLDVGAGEAPYRELFQDQDYVTLDRRDTPHSGEVDLYGEADSIPAPEGSFDAVLCTQVLEHVAAPLGALCEFLRVLRPGGAIIATVPFAWEEHESPYDYYRYTRYGIEHLASSAGFEAIEITPRTDCFTTLAQLVHNAGWAMGSAADGMDELRQEARAVLDEIAEAIAVLAPLDVARVLPLGFSLRASKPVSRQP
jgi:SAM-dependent methyltransferase